MTLRIGTTGQDETAMVSLAADGTLRGPAPITGDKALAQLDQRGCLYDADEGVLAEITGDGELWMIRGTFPAQGRQVAHFVIGPDGVVTSERNTGAPMRLDGFEERGLCAGKLLVGAMLAMFSGVSMAVVEGVAKIEPPPANSACADRHVSAKSP